MLDLIFLVLFIIIIVKANKGIVNDTLCNVALVIGVLAGIAGLVQAFFIKGSGNFWIMNIIVMLIAFALKRAAQYLAKLYRDREDELARRYRKATERISRFDENKQASIDYDDPNVRFGGGSGENWNGK